MACNVVVFYTGSMFPPEYKNRVFLTQRGSWNRTEKIGFRCAYLGGFSVELRKLDDQAANQ